MYSSKEELLEGIKKEGVEYVDIRFCDLPGVMQHFSIPASESARLLPNWGTATSQAFLMRLLGGSAAPRRSFDFDVHARQPHECSTSPIGASADYTTTNFATGS